MAGRARGDLAPIGGDAVLDQSLSGATLAAHYLTLVRESLGRRGRLNVARLRDKQGDAKLTDHMPTPANCDRVRAFSGHDDVASAAQREPQRGIVRGRRALDFWASVTAAIRVGGFGGGATDRRDHPPPLPTSPACTVTSARSAAFSMTATRGCDPGR